ncbi:MAG: DNA alkylation repair protein [Bacteroidaceae bacterium]|nr:DNA alkylation repair protein [Bacteroidaceae bacterium]
MIEQILTPLISERFLSDERYREGHLRVLNALPRRRVLGLHTPQMKQLAKALSKEDGEGYIRRFEQAASDALVYEETLVWGFLINLQKCPLQQRLAMLERYIPVLDNWAVCDAFCANAKWMQRSDKERLWCFLLRWFASQREFEVRFAIVAAMCYFIDREWIATLFEQIERIDFSRITSQYRSVKSRPERPQLGTVQGASPYYVRMGVAWLLATALAKFPDETRAYVRSSTLPDDVIRLYVRKARESFRTRSVQAV